MAHVEENDLMIGFYLSSPILQREILDEYQSLIPEKQERKSLLHFLEEKFKIEAAARQKNVNDPPAIA